MNSKAIAHVSGEADALDGRAITAATGDLNSKVKCTSSWKITVAQLGFWRLAVSR